MIKYITLLVCCLFIIGCTVNGDYVVSTPTVAYPSYYGYSYPYYGYGYSYPYYGYNYSYPYWGGYGYGWGGWNRCRYW